MPADLPTPSPGAAERPDIPSVDALTTVFHAAVAAGDARGVDASLRCIAVQDPATARALYDSLDLALMLADRWAAAPGQTTTDEGARP